MEEFAPLRDPYRSDVYFLSSVVVAVGCLKKALSLPRHIKQLIVPDRKVSLCRYGLCFCIDVVRFTIPAARYCRCRSCGPLLYLESRPTKV